MRIFLARALAFCQMLSSVGQNAFPLPGTASHRLCLWAPKGCWWRVVLAMPRYSESSSPCSPVGEKKKMRGKKRRRRTNKFDFNFHEFEYQDQDQDSNAVPSSRKKSRGTVDKNKENGARANRTPAPPLAIQTRRLLLNNNNNDFTIIKATG